MNPRAGLYQRYNQAASSSNSSGPSPIFLVTFILPEALRPLARSNQKTIYHVLFHLKYLV